MTPLPMLACLSIPSPLYPSLPLQVNRQLQVLHEALQAFEKLHTLVPSAPEVIYQIATLYETMGNYKAAIKYFNLLISKVPTDPGILAHLGQIYAKEEDDAQAFHYHQESYRFYPVSLDVSWARSGGEWGGRPKMLP